MSKQITIGMIAHVDAGKTTLSEALLYQTGIIRRLGRVDNGDAFLDSDQLEKKRVLSRNAGFSLADLDSNRSLLLSLYLYPSVNSPLVFFEKAE